MSNVHNIEKTAFRSSSADEKLPYVLSETIPVEVAVVERPKFLQKCVDFMRRLGGEERGIERVLPHEKSNQKPFDNFSIWYVSEGISMLTRQDFRQLDGRYLLSGNPWTTAVVHGMVGLISHDLVLQLYRHDSASIHGHLRAQDRPPDHLLYSLHLRLVWRHVPRLREYHLMSRMEYGQLYRWWSDYSVGI